jgi:hydroxymethylbilane synthase
VRDGRLHFRGLIARPDGSALLEAVREGAAGDAVRLGADAGGELKARAGPDFFASV